jgi:hypothetical protein
VLKDVEEFRIESRPVNTVDGYRWQGPPYSLRLIVIVRPGTLPPFGEGAGPSCPVAIRNWLRSANGDLRATGPDIAARLVENPTTLSAEGRYFCWLALAEAWAIKATKVGRQRGGEDAARVELLSEVISIDEYPLARYRMGESLDVDDLSEPVPVDYSVRQT